MVWRTPRTDGVPTSCEECPENPSHCHGDLAMPKARSAGQCAQCEADDRVRMTFMTCSRCRRYFCSEHGTSQLDQCEACIEGGEETD